MSDSPQDVSIRPALEEDAVALAAIYNDYVLNSCISFETEAVSRQEFAARIAKTLAIPLPWLLAEASGEVLGYACASPWKARQAYRYCVETAIYLHAKHTHKGIGLVLYAALIDQLKVLSMHSAIGGIALPNDASIKLHERLGFKRIGQFDQVGYKHDRWVDVGYWQLLL